MAMIIKNTSWSHLSYGMNINSHYLSYKASVSEKEWNVMTIPDFIIAIVLAACTTVPGIKIFLFRFPDGHLKLTFAR